MNDRLPQDEDKLAAFRTDLVIEPRHGSERTLYRVADPLTGTQFELDQLEFRVACVLDGKHNAQEVADALREDGVVVRPREVRAFYRELRGLGFVRTSDDLEQTHRADVATFLSQAREYLHSGRPALARGLYEAALELDPECQAASVGLEQCNKAPAAERGTGPTRERRSPVLWAFGTLLVAAAGLGGYWANVGLPWGKEELSGGGRLLAPRGSARRGTGVPREAGSTEEASAATQMSEGGIARPPKRPSPPSAAPSPAEASPVPAPEQHAFIARIVRRKRLPPSVLRAADDGWFLKRHVRAGDHVTTDTVVATFAKHRGDATEIGRLRKRVTALRKLAKESSAYEEFLATARERLRSLRGPAAEVQLTAPADGTVTQIIARKDSVDRGQALCTVAPKGLSVEVHIPAKRPAFAIETASCLVEDDEGNRTVCHVGRTGSTLVADVPDPPDGWEMPDVRLRLVLEASLTPDTPGGEE